MNEIVNIDTAPAPSKPLRKRTTKRSKASTTVCIVLMLIIATTAILLFRDVISKGAGALLDSYTAAYAYEKDSAYQALYQKYYDSAEAEYHVQNRASIRIGNISETGKLEVLKVSDVELIIDDSNLFEGGITSWLEVPGEGTYVVDLEAAEFVVDNDRAYVLARVPYPELTNVSIDYSNVNKILFKDDVFNGSYKQGEELARKQLSEADLLIKKEFASNERFYLNAQDAAESTIMYLIQQLNPGVENLVVEVEFY